MKKFISMLLIIALFISCEKGKRGNVIYNVKFMTETISQKKSLTKGIEIDSDSLYSQFGDYITSLTPSKFTSGIWTLGYADKVGWDGCNALQYIEQNSEKLSHDDPSRIVDFSNNATVSFQPVIYGNLDKVHNTFATPKIDFIYFYFIPYYFYQEVELPTQYHSIPVAMFANGIQGNILKVKHYQMINKIFPNAKTNFVIYYIFGNCDSTFVVNKNSEYVGLSVNSPIADAENDLTIRSNKYTNMIFNSPYNGETVVMNGSVSFNTVNLIQVYAGFDNIPYTSDDIFVYAPKFWERFNVRLDVN